MELEAPVETRFACERSKQGRKGGGLAREEAGTRLPLEGARGCQSKGWFCTKVLARGEMSPNQECGDLLCPSGAHLLPLHSPQQL